MHFFRDCGVSAVLQSSCMTYTLRLRARCFLALTKKLLFVEMPFILFTAATPTWSASISVLFGGAKVSSSLCAKFSAADVVFDTEILDTSISRFAAALLFENGISGML